MTRHAVHTTRNTRVNVYLLRYIATVLAIFDYTCYSTDIKKTVHVLAEVIEHSLKRPDASGELLMRQLLLFTGIVQHVSSMAQKNVAYYKDLCADFHKRFDPQFVKSDFTVDGEHIKTRYKWTERDILDLHYLVNDATEKWQWIIDYAVNNRG